jgi:hypothetical protein
MRCETDNAVTKRPIRNAMGGNSTTYHTRQAPSLAHRQVLFLCSRIAHNRMMTYITMFASVTRPVKAHVPLPVAIRLRLRAFASPMRDDTV